MKFQPQEVEHATTIASHLSTPLHGLDSKTTYVPVPCGDLAFLLADAQLCHLLLDIQVASWARLEVVLPPKPMYGCLVPLHLPVVVPYSAQRTSVMSLLPHDTTAFFGKGVFCSPPIAQLSAAYTDTSGGCTIGSCACANSRRCATHATVHLQHELRFLLVSGVVLALYYI